MERGLLFGDIESVQYRPLVGNGFTQVKGTALEAQGKPDFVINRITPVVDMLRANIGMQITHPETHAIWS
ncbi:hypothetical protein ACFL4H_00110 [Candidatus Neomarinimicrobiota bacterium]